MYQPQQKPSNNQEIEYRNELSDYLEQKLTFKGKCVTFKYNPKHQNYQITLTEVKPLSAQVSHLKFDYHVNIFAKPKNIADIGLGYEIEFECIPIVYYTWKKIEGIDVKVKNYGLKLIDIIDYEQPERGEKNGDN